MKIAVIGSGISGLSSAYYLSKKHKVDLFEKQDRFGGHSYTLDIKLNDKEKASFYYQKIISDHQGSIYASQARERFRILRGDKLNNDL